MALFPNGDCNHLCQMPCLPQPSSLPRLGRDTGSALACDPHRLVWVSNQESFFNVRQTFLNHYTLDPALVKMDVKHSFFYLGEQLSSISPILLGCLFELSVVAPALQLLWVLFWVTPPSLQPISRAEQEWVRHEDHRFKTAECHWEPQEEQSDQAVGNY